MIGQDENIILQQLISVSFITELHNSNFLESEFYQKMSFGNPSIKPYVDQIKIGNQGMLIMFLYALLLIPKEKIYSEYKNEYDLLDSKIDGLKTYKESTYPSDKYKTEYIKHIRNAIAHGRIEYAEDSVIFKDIFENRLRNYRFLVELPFNKIGHLLSGLENILYKYVDDLQSKP